MQHVLLTGFPGFVAENLVGTCHRTERPVFWHLLVLPEQVAPATRRLRELDVPVANYAIYPGDVTKPELGLAATVGEDIQQRIQLCFHLAAQSDPTASDESAELVNVQGTLRLVEFLTRCERLRRFNYVSASHVSGMMDGPIPEDALPEPPGFRNAYERTKYDAEKLVRDYADRLPTTIFRPAVVVGHSQSGQTTKFDGPYVLISFVRWFRHLMPWMPNLGFEDSYLNSVPVDFVTRILAEVGFSEDFIGQTLHVTDPDPPTTAQAFEAVYGQMTGRHCVPMGDRSRRALLWCLHGFPMGLATGLSARSLEYLRHQGQYRTENLRSACRRFDIDIPRWREFYKPVIRFALSQKRFAPNAAAVRQFGLWCWAFRFIYPVVGLAFLLIPGLLIELLTVLDDPTAASMLYGENVLWRPLAISLIAALFVGVTFLERDPFQKPLHILFIGAKFLSSIAFFALAAVYGLMSMAVCGLIDGLIGLVHLLFYYRLSRIQPMTGGEFRWDPYHLLFPDWFIDQFAETMSPKLADPIDRRLIVESVRENVHKLPFHVRYGFVFACHYASWIMPCLCGRRPFRLMDEQDRRRFLQQMQGQVAVWIKLPMVFIKLIASPFVFGQEPYLRSIGVR